MRYEVQTSGRYESTGAWEREYVHTHDVVRVGELEPISGGSFRGDEGLIQAVVLCERLNRELGR